MREWLAAHLNSLFAIGLAHVWPPGLAERPRRGDSALPYSRVWEGIAAFGILHGACDLFLFHLLQVSPDAAGESLLLAVGLGLLSALSLAALVFWALLARARLHESETRFRDLVEGSLQGMMVIQGERRVFANPTYLRLFGLASAEEAQSLADIVNLAAPYERDRLRAIISARNANRPAPEIYELVWLRKNGEEVTLLNIARGIVWNGSPAVQVTFVDITERRRAEDELRASQRLLQTAFDAVPHRMFIRGSDRRFQLVNRAWSAQFGLQPSDAIGRTATELFGSASTYSPEALRRIEREDTRVLELGVPSEVPDEPFVHTDGSPGVSRVIRAPVTDEAGAVVALVGIAEDITERKRSEAERVRLASALEHAGDGIFITDRFSTIVYANPAFETISGYSKDELIGSTPKLLSSGLQPPEFYSGLWNSILSGQTWSGRYVNATKARARYTVDTTIAPIRDDNAKISHFVAVYRDVTDHLRLEEQLHRSRRLEAVGTLAGGIAHDFNNLLSPILGFAELLKAELEGDADRAALVGHILDAARRGRELTQRILLFSRETSAPRELCDLAPIIHEVLALLGSTLPRSISIQPDIATKADPVECDSAQIHQVLMNLCINAAQAMPSGGVLGVRLDRVDLRDRPVYLGKPLTGSFARIEVSDTGVGMTDAVMSHIFDPFFTTREVGTGTGLGLSTVLGIVQEHGGAVDVRSRPDAGSTFTVYLPRVKAGASPAQAAAPAPVGGTESILCVDDEPAIVALLSHMLQAVGYRVSAFVEPAAALAALRAEPLRFDLVISDLTMPGIGGDELARRIHGIRADLPVLVCTGNEDRLPGEGDRSPAIADVLLKPVEWHELSRTVRRILDQKPAPLTN